MSTAEQSCRNCGQPIVHVETFAASITDFDWVHVPSYANECHPYTTAEPAIRNERSAA